MPAGLYLQEDACHGLLLGGGPHLQGTGRGGGHPHAEVQAGGAPGHLLPRYDSATASCKKDNMVCMQGDADTAAYAKYLCEVSMQSIYAKHLCIS